MFQSVLAIFPQKLRESLLKSKLNEQELEEIRIRIHQPMIFLMNSGEYFFRAETGQLTKEEADGYVAEYADIQAILTFLSRYSIYAYSEEVKNGFITLEGGHRVGLAGQVVMEEGRVIQMAYISFLNIRVAHQCIGCAEKLYPYLQKNGRVWNTLIISSPGMGKTTCLRDCIRLLSGDGHSQNHWRIGVVDERSEIAACHMGIPQNNLGIRTDVLDRCGKAEGMRMLLRSMAPDVIAVDELGGEEDIFAVEQVLNSGCSILGTMHAADIEELQRKEKMKKWIEEQIFERYVVLRKQKDGRRCCTVYDSGRKEIWSD